MLRSAPRFFSVPLQHFLVSPPRKRGSSNHRRLLDPRFRGDDRLFPGALLAQFTHAGVKNGSGAPSVGLNTTLTFWPIFSVSMSQSIKLVCSDGPSFKVT